MRLKKALRGVLIVLVVLLLALLVVPGPVVKSLVNTAGPQLLGVPVEIKSAAIRPFSGTLRLAGVRVGNPEGYSADDLFSLGEIRVALDMRSLAGRGPIIIKELAIIEPKVAYEVVKGKSNIEALTANLSQGDKAKGKKEKKGKKEEKEGRKVVIDLLEFRDGELSYRAKMTLGQAITLPLPGLKLTGLGREKDGMSTTEAIGKVLGELLNVVGTVVAKIGTAAVDAGKATVDAGTAVVGAGVDAVGAGVGAVGSAATGLFNAVVGGDKEKDAPEGDAKGE